MPVSFFGQAAYAMPHGTADPTAVSGWDTATIDITTCPNPCAVLVFGISDKTNGAVSVEHRASGHTSQPMTFVNAAFSLTTFEVEMWALAYTSLTAYSNSYAHVDLDHNSVSAFSSMVVLQNTFSEGLQYGAATADESVSPSAIVPLSGSNAGNLLVDIVAFDNSVPLLTAVNKQGADIFNTVNDTMGIVSHYGSVVIGGTNFGWNLTDTREWVQVGTEFKGPATAVRDIIHAGGLLVYGR